MKELIELIPTYILSAILCILWRLKYEKEMLYTLSVNLEYFEKEMERAERFYRNGKRADSYAHIAKMLKFTCSLVKERLDEIKE